MGNSRYNFGTQLKEKARQQKQTDKATKRMLARQKKVYIKTSPSKADADIEAPIFAQDIVESTDLPIRP